MESGLNTVNDWCFDTENGWRGIELYESGVASQLIIITASEAEFTGDIIPDLKQKVGCSKMRTLKDFLIPSQFDTRKRFNEFHILVLVQLSQMATRLSLSQSMRIRILLKPQQI